MKRGRTGLHPLFLFYKYKWYHTMKNSTQAAKCLMGTGVSLLLLAAPVPLQGQPATAKTTSYTRYSEWMNNSLYNSASTDYHYDYSLLYEAMMDTYLAYKNDANTKLETDNVKKVIDTYAATCASPLLYAISIFLKTFARQ